MKKLTLGILAHVDAGKTTLSEGLLYLCGCIRRLGRVDHRDTFLDTAEPERSRGITVFSKQAVLETPDMTLYLLDTPGHTDFSAEMERVLSVLDYAVLVISASDGVQVHTETLWRLLQRHGLERSSKLVIDATSVKETKSLLVLDDGRVAISSMTANVIIKHADKDLSGELGD